MNLDNVKRNEGNGNSQMLTMWRKKADSGKHLQTIRQKVELFMKFSVFLICVLVVVLAIGFVEWVEKKVRNQDDDDDWGGSWPY